MAKEIAYVCSECGMDYQNWQGRCESCGQWNSLVEFKLPKDTRGKVQPAVATAKNSNTPKTFAQIELDQSIRIKTGISELDRVFGGGIVKGEVLLLGGDPGIGKSTLLLQAITNMPSVKTLYVSGEESLAQIKMRAERLGKTNSTLQLLDETNLNDILTHIELAKPSIVVIDSIQTIFCADFPSSAGSIVQVRECAQRLITYAKSTGTAIILVGHVTKEGTVAGPRVLEHLVDAVVYLEGDRSHTYRIVRTAKNRFGSVDETGVFEMQEQGLVEVTNPSRIFLDERLAAPGSAVTAIISGSRPFLIEVQALCTKSSFGYPKRTASGFDLNRLQILIAVLTKKAGLKLEDKDIFVNIAGGFKAEEPAVDLAVCAAIYSSYKAKPVREGLVVFGEVGLSGELRNVAKTEQRINEAKNLGFTEVVIPQGKTESNILKVAKARSVAKALTYCLEQ